ncbi:SUMO ligase MMS21 [Lachancea thermotolerans CBS 6340]|uniref:KLTH0H14058p n=1 Tax=Lachancea thermotolerans (strain ATCC 56472 / CBS 6340 / NRRL Y-8284) TaxID=559295 RepID=C5E3J4_LACTC|nr:KLTH0H14058p [Lachancea thermotolerans CBS 6340]CAR30605.1 KLTH0H14058p [Lachancea thermotolerans CBS 6340]
MSLLKFQAGKRIAFTTNTNTKPMPRETPTAVPESVPLHHTALQVFHDWRPSDISAILNETRSQFSQLLDQLSEVNATSPDVVDTLTQTFREFRHLEAQQNSLQNNIDLAKSKYRSQCEELPPVTWETWDAYREGELRAPHLLHVFEETERDSESQPPPANSADELSRLYRALPHIAADPQCILPDEAADDDVQIAGGQIELACPITCKPFQRPMISRKCGHVFDHAGIEQYLSAQSTRDCPQGACGQKVSMRDFVPDRLMELRCKITRAREGSRKAQRALENVVPI